MRAAVFVALLAASCGMQAQQPVAARLPPSEELKAATEPLLAARAQPNDLTQADLIAYGIGVTRAGKACLRLEPALDEVAKTPDELLALGRLCIFGLQYGQAVAAGQRYLKLANPVERDKALLLLADAFLGLKDPANATSQILQLTRDYPYDPQIHFAIDRAVLAGALLSDTLNGSSLDLCQAQWNNTLPLLDQGKALTGKDGSSASASTLFGDAVRCLDIARALGDKSAPGTMAHLQKIADLPAWQGTAELAAMQSSLARAELVGKPTPVSAISGRLVHGAAPSRPFTADIAHGAALLVPFTLYTPGATSLVENFHATAPQQPIYLLTSWAANTGGADEESKAALESLRSVAASLPARVSLVIVPDSLLQQFHADDFPAAIVVRDGIVQADLALVGDADKRLAVLALGATAAAPRARQ